MKNQPMNESMSIYSIAQYFFSLPKIIEYQSIKKKRKNEHCTKRLKNDTNFMTCSIKTAFNKQTHKQSNVVK